MLWWWSNRSCDNYVVLFTLNSINFQFWCVSWCENVFYKNVFKKILLFYLSNSVLFDHFCNALHQLSDEVINNYCKILSELHSACCLRSAFLCVILHFWLYVYFLNAVMLLSLFLLRTASHSCQMTIFAVFTLCWHVMTVFVWFDMTCDDFADVI